MAVRRRVSVLVAALAILVAAGVLGVSALAADGLVHPGRGAVDRTPEQLGLAFEDVTLTTADGIVLSGWWIPADEPTATVLLLHGYSKTRLEVLPHAGYLHDAGYDVLLFDWRAHGRSGGTFTSLGYHERLDLRAAVDEAKRRLDAPVAALGYSMGAATGIVGGAEDERIAALIADSPFATVDASLDTAFPILANPKLPAFPFAPLALRIAELGTGLRASDVRPVDAIAGWAPRPVLLIAGSEDELVPPSESDRLASVGGATTRLLRFEGAGHPGSAIGEAWTTDPDRYRAEVLAFLDSALGAR